MEDLNTPSRNQSNEERGYERYAAYLARARQLKLGIYRSAMGAKR